MGDAAQIGIHDGLGQLPDHELVELVIEGQKQAYKTLVERYQGRIFRVACLYNVSRLIAGRMIWHLKHVTVISERPMQMFHFGSHSRSALRAEAPM